MGDVSDEALMAFADGELSPAERVQIEKALARDPELRARLEIFDATGRRLSAEYAAHLNEPLPQHLIDTVMREGYAGSARRTASAAKSLWDRLSRSLSVEMPVWQTALASTAVLVAGIGTGYQISRTVSPPVPTLVESLIALDNGHIVVAGRLSQILETQPGHIVHGLEDAGGDRQATARIRLTFRSKVGYCRQFEVAGRSGFRAAEVACRSEDGSWRLRAHAIGGVGASIGQGARPAGEDGASIEAAVDQLKIGDALGADDEAAVISRRWQR